MSVARWNLAAAARILRRGVRLCAVLLAEHRGALARSLLLLFGSAGLTVAGPWLIGYIVDKALITGNSSRLVLCAAGYLALESARLLTGAAYALSLARLGQSVMQGLRLRLFAHFLRLETAEYDRRQSGALLSYLTSDVQSLSELFTAGFMTAIEKLVITVFIVVVLFSLNARLALIALAPFFVLFVGAPLGTFALYRSYRRLRSANARLSEFVVESVSGMPVIKLFARRRLWLAEGSAVFAELESASFGPIRVHGMFHPSVTIVNGISMMLLLYYGGGAVIEGRLTPGLLVSFFSYILWLFWPLIIIIDRLNIFVGGMAALERVTDALEMPCERDEPGPGIANELGSHPDNSGQDSLGVAIEFRGVWFAYHGEEWILRDFSVNISAGERVALFGSTGAGKSTVIGLLLRLYDPQRGSILINGRDIRAFERARLRRLFGYVQQDPMLFRGTVGENIALFGAASPQIPESLRSALPALDDSADRLSAGQRQALAFVRALGQSPRAWILDEATAHVDPLLDKGLERVLLDEGAGRTLVIIAHRISALGIVDRVLVLEGGRLRDAGTHAELLARDGYYARLVRIQAALERSDLFDGNAAIA